MNAKFRIAVFIITIALPIFLWGDFPAWSEAGVNGVVASVQARSEHTLSSSPILGPFVDPSGAYAHEPAVREGPLLAPSISDSPLDESSITPTILPLRKTPRELAFASNPVSLSAPDSFAFNPFDLGIETSGRMPFPLVDFEGLRFTQTGYYLPPDPNGDVGPNHYIQLVNVAMGIYQKTLGGAYYEGMLNDFFVPSDMWLPSSQAFMQTPCYGYHRGDPVVVYDPLVDRWLVSDFAWKSYSAFYQCLAVSRGPDPVQDGWYFYAMRADTGNFTGYLNDYPKLGVWSDGWYLTANMVQLTSLENGFGVRIWALDRAAMIAGEPLREVHFDLCRDGACDSLLPANLRGVPPPEEAPNYLMAAILPDTLALWRFHVDWVDPLVSTLSSPKTIQVEPFNVAAFAPQLESSQFLDSLSPRLMMQLQYRYLDGRETLWANHTVDSGGIAGIRWYEVHDPNGTPSLAQQGTYQPDADYRWMASLATDRDGNLAFGYSVSSAEMYPAIRIAGRLAGEVPGLLTQAERELVAGEGSQTVTHRWGDYTAMTVDPLDDCTFWYTNEYYLSSGMNWHTHIASFRYPSCGQPKGYVTGVIRDAVSGKLLSGVPVIATNQAYTLTVLTDPTGVYSMTLAAGTYDLSAGPFLPGYPQPAATLGQDVTAGLTLSLDFALQPYPYLTGLTPLLEDQGPQANGNGIPEPGERGLLMWRPLSNTGAITSTQIEATLISQIPSVTVTVTETSYPDIAIGDVVTNTTPYSFNLDPALPCGTQLIFQQVITDSLSVYTHPLTFDAAISLPRKELFRNTAEPIQLTWTTGGDRNTWGIITLYGAPSPPTVWTDSPGGFYRANTNSYLSSPALNLSGMRNVQLSFWIRYDLEIGFDFLYVETSLDGGQSWDPQPLRIFNGYQSEWSLVTIDMPHFDQQPNAAFRFRLQTDEGLQLDGVYLDDIALSYELFTCDYPVSLPPVPPVLLTPASGDQYFANFYIPFNWVPGPSGSRPEGYVFYLDNSSPITFTTQNAAIAMILEPGYHNWSLRAFNQFGVSSQSPPNIFLVIRRLFFPLSFH